MKQIAIKRFIIAIVLAIINVLAFSNLSVCCGKSYTEKELELSAISGEGAEILDRGSVFINPDGGYIEISNINLETATITLEFSTEKSAIIRGKLLSTDEGRKYDFREIENFCFNDKFHTVQKAFISSGKLRSLRIEIESSAGGVCLEKIILNKKTKFRFNFFTYGIMLLIWGVMFCLKKSDCLKSRLDNLNKKQIVEIGLIKGICIIAALIIALSQQNGEKWFLTYEKGTETEIYNLYMEVFDAFHHRTAKMNAYGVDPRLEELDNVYDLSERIEAGVVSRWDMAFYQGNYYCYFGVLPIIVFFEFFYIFTGYLPGMIVLTFLLLCFGVFFLFGSTRKLLEYFEIIPSVSYYLLANCVILFASFYYIIASNSDHYTLTIICAIDFLLACIYFAYSAFLEKQKIWRMLKYIACGVAFVGIAATRPAMVLMGMAFIFPPFFGLLFEKNVQWKSKLRDVLVFAIPVLIGAGVLMAYNYVRFDSPFEFGAQYQLTVGDIRYNSITLNFKNILGAIYCYFLEPIKFELEFPFVLANDSMIWTAFGKVCYREACIGIFAIPFNLLAFGIFAHDKVKRRSDKMKKVTCISILMAVLIIAITDFTMGGVVGRYVGDFAIGIAFLAFLTVMEWSMEGKLDRGMPRLIVDFIMVSSIILGILLLFKNDLVKNYIIKRQPDVFMLLHNMFDL